MNTYKGVLVVERRRFSELKPVLNDFREKGLREVRTPRFKVLLKHLERDEWVAVVKNRGEFVLVHGGLDVMFGPPEEENSCRSCTKPWCGDCPLFQSQLAVCGPGGGCGPGI